MSDEAVRLYLARGVTEVAEDERHVGHHEEADMPYSWVPLDEAVDKILAGELHNPLTVSGVLAAAAARAEGSRRCGRSAPFGLSDRGPGLAVTGDPSQAQFDPCRQRRSEEMCIA